MISSKNDAQKRLLAIDGGGVRGIMAIKVLARIERILREHSGNPNLVLADYFDYIGGTSTGGIVAAALAIGLSTAEIEQFYRFHAPQLFSVNRNPIKKLLYARYDAAPLEKILKEVFGVETTLGSPRLKTLLLLVMLNAGTTSPWPISSNPSAKYNDPMLGGESNLNLPLWQLVRASTAAPYFFEPEQINVGQNKFLFYDGALTSLNNPAFKLFQMATLPGYRLQWPTGADQLLLVSVGTGLIPKEIPHLGLFDKQLGTTMINAMQSLMCAGMVEADLQCRTVGRVIAGQSIDGEVGDLVGERPAGGNPLFTYLRYNATLTTQGLASFGCAGLMAKTTFRLDDLAAIEPCATVGDAIAEQCVKAEHFLSFPPLAINS